jgi:hypothetical protein
MMIAYVPAHWGRETNIDEQKADTALRRRGRHILNVTNGRRKVPKTGWGLSATPTSRVTSKTRMFGPMPGKVGYPAWGHLEQQTLLGIFDGILLSNQRKGDCDYRCQHFHTRCRNSGLCLNRVG